ncbi:hypothetical protein BB170200_04504 [Mycobacterium marinum]|nr:hypothetical protein BB170200_04504 [Mycobacterium marinum]
MWASRSVGVSAGWVWVRSTRVLTKNPISSSRWGWVRAAIGTPMAMSLVSARVARTTVRAAWMTMKTETWWVWARVWIAVVSSGGQLN